MRTTLIAAAFAALLAAPSAASIILDTGLNTDLYATAWAVSPNQSLASEFRLSSATRLTDAVAYFEDATNGRTSGDVIFTIYASGGQRPTDVLFSRTVAVGSPEGYYGLTGLALQLTAGDYFLGFESAGFNGSIRGDAPNAVRDEAFSFGPGKPFREFDGIDLSIQISAVPEASTWALMIVGFGLVGFALRRRAGVVAA